MIFSQGQIAVVVQLPDDPSTDFAKQRMRLRLAPPGMVVFHNLFYTQCITQLSSATWLSAFVRMYTRAYEIL